MNEIRLYGPPGTGKTTSLTQHIKEAVAAAGEEKVLVSSFSKAAAQELVGRDLPIRPDNIGTLHSLCYRAIGDVEIAETRVEEFNRQHPQLRLPENQKENFIDTPEVAAGEGFDLLQQYNLMRSRGLETCNKLLDPDERGKVQGVTTRSMCDFIGAWERWKGDNNLFDFTDLLVIAQEDFKSHPSGASIGFFDEVQDFNPLMMELVRQWGKNMDYTILAGDDDQTIYSFMGASPEVFLTSGSSEDRVLTQSYRLPRAVKEWSERWIKQVSARKEKTFSPTTLAGDVVPLWKNPAITYRTPEKLLPNILKDISDGLSVMVLASCSYMLTPLISVFRAEGIPFSNRYRPSNGSWNPLPLGTERRVPAWTRLLSFLTPILGMEGRDQWTLNDWNCWKKDLSPKADGLLSGVLKKNFALHGSTPMETSNFLEGENETPPFYGSQEDALDWFMESIPPSKRSSYEFPVKCVRAMRTAQVSEPMVTVGTVHSVKGGEADSVYLIPDLSTAGAREFYSGNESSRDSTTRLMYVGATRAKRKLTLVGAYNYNLSVRWID